MTTPETRDDLLHAVTDFCEVMSASLDETELDPSSREAVLDFVQAVSDAAAKLMRKLQTLH